MEKENLYLQNETDKYYMSGEMGAGALVAGLRNRGFDVEFKISQRSVEIFAKFYTCFESFEKPLVLQRKFAKRATLSVREIEKMVDDMAKVAKQHGGLVS